ncbi:unnamed protein product [Clonostachys rosea f. rosea IK726]|uniref:Uncharacterized protein n=2 Tax=Bionectria ochroleuca TaxID=29856 RepID=A0A0B7K5Z8_BIOOC|nr:unnamed protein product [Clonostachys rosea f. rosea IK726]
MNWKGLLVTASLAAVLPFSGAQQSTNPCRQVAKQQVEARAGVKLDYSSDQKFLVRFDGETAYKCITSVPIDNDAASTMIDVLKRYFSFQSSIAYLKDPPKSYQQLPVDVMGRFDEIKTKIGNKNYTNQYELELDIRSIIRDAHDGHFTYSAGILGLFTWSLNESIISVSPNGRELPQVFAYSDIINDIQNASPIVEFDGKSVFTYLQTYLKERSDPTAVVDPHAAWNRLMQSSASVLGKTGHKPSASVAYNHFQATQIYNGPSLRGKFANGTTFEWAYMAGSSTNLTKAKFFDAEAIYQGRVLNSEYDDDEFVVKAIDESSKPVQATEATLSASATTSNKTYVGYPTNPIVTQVQFGLGGVVSGYLLTTDSVGVLSLPGFRKADGASLASYRTAVSDFIAKAKKAGVKKVVIDLSGNGGGQLPLAFDIFNMFFPSTRPSHLFRARAVPELLTYGRFVTGITMNKNKLFNSSTVSVVTDEYTNNRVFNADYFRKPGNAKWASFDDFYGPVTIHNDSFTNNGQYEYDADGFNIARRDDTSPPFKAEDIVLLTDGVCASTCFVFASLMKTGAGVKSVVVGGIPQNSPMQATSGTRGSNVRDLSFISDSTDMVRNFARGFTDKQMKGLNITSEDLSNLLPPLDKAPFVVGSSAGVNILDTVFPSSPETPRQFVYEAANCRLFWTRDMVHDITRLWSTAAKYASGDESVCVSGSVDGLGSRVNDTITDSPGFSYSTIWQNANQTNISKTDGSPNSNSGGGDQNQKDDDSAGHLFELTPISLVAMTLTILLAI